MMKLPELKLPTETQEFAESVNCMIDGADKKLEDILNRLKIKASNSQAPCKTVLLKVVK